MSSSISNKDWQQWAANPVTQQFQKWIEEAEADTLKAWARQQFVGSTSDETVQMNAFALGGLDFLRQVISKIQEASDEEGEQS